MLDPQQRQGVPTDCASARGRPTEHPDHLLRQLIAWQQSGLGPTEMARKLHAWGIPTRDGGAWYASTCAAALKSKRAQAMRDQG